MRNSWNNYNIQRYKLIIIVIWPVLTMQNYIRIQEMYIRIVKEIIIARKYNMSQQNDNIIIIFYRFDFYFE